MANRTIVVAIDPNMDNFSVLGLRHSLRKGHEIVIHNSPALNVQGAETVFNFDILITGKDRGDHLNEVVPLHRIAQIPRYKKFTQAVKLQNAVKTYPGEQQHHFMHVPTWLNGWGGRNYPPVMEPMVVKPNDGARGIGQFVVDTNKVNMDFFLRDMKKLVDGEHTQVRLDQFIESYSGNVTYHAGSENTPLEGLGALKEDGAVVQTVIENVVKEYRVITDKDCKPVYFQERRKRNEGSTFPQATGGGTVIDREMVRKMGDIPSCVNIPLLEHLCRHVIGPVSSIDLFVTRDGYWGIFEYCNQFGISGIPQDFVFNLHAEFVQDLVDTYLAVEKGE